MNTATEYQVTREGRACAGPYDDKRDALTFISAAVATGAQTADAYTIEHRAVTRGPWAITTNPLAAAAKAAPSCCDGTGWTGDHRAPCPEHYEPSGLGGLS